MVKSVKTVLFTFFLAAAFYGIYGQASSKTMEDPVRGEGGAEISGYAVTNLHFQLGEDPATLSVVNFDLDGPARQVWIHFDSPSNQVFSCSNPAGYHWICELNEVNTGEVTEIQISASG
jgi:hypothetical protein